MFLLILLIIILVFIKLINEVNNHDLFFCVIVNLMNLITLHLDFVLLNSDYNSVSGLTLFEVLL
jgi:hypothetical protein